MPATRASGNYVNRESDLLLETTTKANANRQSFQHQPGVVDLATTAVIIPALNEADNLAILLPSLSAMNIRQIIVADNGSTDATAQTANQNGADVASAPKRGYGAACQAGIARLRPEIDIVVFLDADQSDDHTLLPRLVEPIQSGAMDLVLTARVKHLRRPGSMTMPQALGTGLAVLLIRLGWRRGYQDLGPFRAIRRSSLDQINMQDQAFGWTVEMQIRAVEEDLRIQEIETPYFRRSGRSKISGTIKGICLAGYWILSTCTALYLTRSKRKIRTLHGSGGHLRHGGR